MTKILDGKKLAEKILENLKKEIKKKQLKLKLAVVFVGQNPMSKIFIRQKEKACRKVGIDFELYNFSAKINREKLEKTIKEIAENLEVSGMIIQLPLPKKFNTDKILNLIPPKKNVEIISPVVCAIEHFFKEYRISLQQKFIVLVGRGRLVGRPVTEWLRKKNLKFYNIDKSSTFQWGIKPRRRDTGVRKVLDKIKKADIIISGVGKKNTITGDMVKKGAVVIDVGGDVDFQAVSKKASYISPVPGGVGPLTVACLLKNLVWIYTYSNE